MHVTVYPQTPTLSKLSLDFEEGSSIDVLKIQIFSLIDSFEDILLLDRYGCEITCSEDLLDVNDNGSNVEVWIYDSSVAERLPCTSLFQIALRQPLFR